MIDIKEKSNCSGCTSCMAVCPVGAIKMVEDQEGFKYPVVDKAKCINCGLCEKVCPYNKDYFNEKAYKTAKVYGGWSNDEEYRKRGTSGGVFSNFAKYILENNGAVCGAVYNNNLEVEHIVTQNFEDVKKMNGSKYVQSDLKNVFKEVKEYLEKDIKVLFTGTPCQITGLLKYLQKDYDNLYTLDIVCHGVPSPKVFRKYKKYLEEINKSKLKEISFRTKITGWKRYSTYAKYENGKEEIMYASENPYMRGFLKDIYLRPSCNNCISSKLPRNSDITLGDFWGVNNCYPNLDSEMGTSLMLINSPKGENLLNEIKNKINVSECELEPSIKDNPAIRTSAKINPKRTEFFEKLDNTSFESLAKKYFPKTSLVKKIYYKIRGALGKIKRLIIK